MITYLTPKFVVKNAFFLTHPLRLPLPARSQGGGRGWVEMQKFLFNKSQ